MVLKKGNVPDRITGTVDNVAKKWCCGCTQFKIVAKALKVLKRWEASYTRTRDQLGWIWNLVALSALWMEGQSSDIRKKRKLKKRKDMMYSTCKRLMISAKLWDWQKKSSSGENLLKKPKIAFCDGQILFQYCSAYWHNLHRILKRDSDRDRDSDRSDRLDNITVLIWHSCAVHILRHNYTQCVKGVDTGEKDQRKEGKTGGKTERKQDRNG